MPSSKRQHIRMTCLGVSKAPTYKHLMFVKGRHPRHPHVHVFKCRNLQCTITIYYDMSAQKEVRP